MVTDYTIHKNNKALKSTKWEWKTAIWRWEPWTCFPVYSRSRTFVGWFLVCGEGVERYHVTWGGPQHWLCWWEYWEEDWRWGKTRIQWVVNPVSAVGEVFFAAVLIRNLWVWYSGMKEHPTSLVSAVKLAVPTKTAYVILASNIIHIYFIIKPLCRRIHSSVKCLQFRPQMCISNSFKDFYGLLSFELFRNADRLLYLITQNTSNLVILLVFSHSCNSMVLITVTTS